MKDVSSHIRNICVTVVYVMYTATYRAYSKIFSSNLIRVGKFRFDDVDFKTLELIFLWDFRVLLTVYSSNYEYIYN